MSDNEKHHISSYRSHIIVLGVLLLTTFLTVAVTKIHLNQFTVAVALLIASLKSTVVLLYFMHLKFERRIFKILVSIVMVLLALLILLTFSDYGFR